LTCQSRKQTTYPKKVGFKRNRTRPTTKYHPFLLPKKHTEAAGNDGWDFQYAEKKGGEIRPAGTISREGMRSLLNALYLIPSSMAMVSRKEDLTRVIDDSLEVRYARERGKKVEGGPTKEDFGEAIHWILVQLHTDCYHLMKRVHLLWE
jgi:hypothetical protein